MADPALPIRTLLLAALLTAACAGAPSEPAEVDDAVVAAAVDPVLPPERLPGELIQAAGNGVLLDVRDAAAYGAGHHPAAIRVDPQEWKQLSLDAATGLDRSAIWNHRIGQLGIDGNDTVYVLDDGSMKQAARLWFLLQHFGAAQVQVVDGGWPAVAENMPDLDITTESTSPIPARFVPSTRRAEVGLAGRERVRHAVESGDAQVLDLRSDAEWLGEELRDNIRGGHLPGAVHLPHSALFGEDGRLLPAPQMAQVMVEAGLDPSRPVITHCDGGGRAALGALAATRAGFGPVENYYLSFGDWAADITCPLAQGD